VSRSPTPNRHTTMGCSRVSSPSASGLDLALPAPPSRQKLDRAHASFPRQKLVCASASPLCHLRHGPATSRHASALRRPPYMVVMGRRPPWPHPCTPAGSLTALRLGHREEKQLRCSAINMTASGERRRSGERAPGGGRAHPRPQAYRGVCAGRECRRGLLHPGLCESLGRPYARQSRGGGGGVGEEEHRGDGGGGGGGTCGAPRRCAR
jgi:hypothetical protein